MAVNNILNEHLTMADFARLPKGDQDAFKAGPAPRVVFLREGFELYKLTVAYFGPNLQEAKVSPWWSSLKEFEEDKEGALGRYIQAQMNKVDMSVMTRFMAAVRLDWNDMSDYLQIKLTRPCKAFWGAFAPQSLCSPLVQPADQAGALAGAHLPDTLGVLEAWQLYIPNLTEGDIERVTVVNGHDMAALAPLLRYAPHGG